LFLPLHFAIVANNRPFLSPPEELILQKSGAFRSFATNNILAYIFQYRSQQATTNILSFKIYIMLRWTITFLIVAIIAAVLGFGGLAAGAASIAKILFFIFIVLFVLSLVFGKSIGGTK
jgi:uncharacterized membrane protein YtjA (UPF0391 family)